MVRRIIGRILGYEQELEALRAKLHRAGYDDTFGMLTRQGLEDTIERLPRGEYMVVFIDLDNMHGLNSALGYEEVNERVRKTFNPDWKLRKADIIGRWFSGDEIVLILKTDHDGARMIAQSFLDEAKKHGLGFSYAAAPWNNTRRSIDTLISELAHRVMKQKDLTRIA